MARGFNSTVGAGTTDKITTAESFARATQVSYGIWTYRRAAAGRRMWDGGDDFAQLDRASAGGTYVFFEPDWSGSDAEWAITEPSAGAWHHILVTYDASSTANDPVIYVDGVSVTVTENTAPVGTFTAVACDWSVGNRKLDSARSWDGYLAEFAIWDGVILTAAEAAALGKGVSPHLIRPTSLRVYLPLLRDNTNLKGAAPTVTGTAVQPHPSMIYPTSVWTPPRSASSTVSKSGSDSAALTDNTPAIAAALATSDSASLTDGTPAITAAPAAADSATLTDSSAVLIGTANSDTGTLTDNTLAIAATLAASDTGTLSDAAALLVSHSRTDSVTVTDSTSIAAAASTTDSAALSESVSIAVVLVASDSATLTEVASVFSGANISGSDSGSLTEASSIGVGVQASDGVVLAESVSIAAAVTLSDGGSFSEAASIVATVTVTDLATLDESASVDSGNVTVVVSDVAVLSEAVSIFVMLTVVDGAMLVDEAAVDTGETPNIIPAIGFGVGGRGGLHVGRGRAGRVGSRGIIGSRGIRRR